ncbi:hypothetical protein FRC07_010655, partial [Ceratobasidium sp. 392]
MTTPHRPWSPHPPAHYQEPSTDPRGVENYLQTQAAPQSYYDPYAAQSSMPWQPAPYNPQRQSTLPAAPGYAPYAGQHQQQPTDTSVEALDLAEYSSRLNAQSQPQLRAQPQMYHSQPGYYHPASYPQSAYPVMQSHPVPAQYDYNQAQAQRVQARSPPRDFIDSGPFSYTGVRETSPSPVRIPPPQSRPVPAPRHESPRSSRGHLPWATENDNEHDLGEPDPVFPPSPSSPRRADSTNTFPFNVQQAAATESNAHTATSETLHESQANAPSSDPEMGKDERDWGVHEGDRPGDVGPDGKLISNGPRLRIAVRVLEALTAAGAISACIYAFAVPKPNPRAPPASKPAVYVIVVLGFFTLLAMGYIYILRGCFGIGQKDRDDLGSHAMVLPISHHRAGRGRKGRKHRKGDDSVQVNLIVDPSMFSPNKRESNLTPGVPWTEQQAANSGGVFTSFERERARLSARKGLWWALGLDVLGAV